MNDPACSGNTNTLAVPLKVASQYRRPGKVLHYPGLKKALKKVVRR